jgi:HEAT repeat protein
MTSAGFAVTRAAIEAALSSGDAEERRQATSRIEQLAVADVVPLLVRALGDDSWRVRKEATFVARAFVQEPLLIAALLPLLRSSDDVGLRNAVVEVLAAAGHAATAAVGGAIATLDADGRKLAIEILGRGGDPDALKHLELALGDADANVRQATVEAIAALGPSRPEAAAEVLRRSLDDADPLVQMTALDGLTTLGVRLSWERLAPLVSTPTLRAAALRAAAVTGSPEAVSALAQAVAEARGGVFTQALSALATLSEGPLASCVGECLASAGAIAGERLVALATGATGEGAESRRMALVVAVVARAPGAVEAALRALSDPDLADTAPRAVRMLGAAAIGPILSTLAAADAEPSVRPVLVDLVAELALELDPGARIEQVRRALRAAARDADRAVAGAAIAAIARLGTEDDLPLVAELASSPVTSIAHAAERVLAVLAQRAPVSARSLAAAESQRDPTSLAATVVVGALAASGEPTFTGVDADLAFLAQAATTGDARIRRAAVAAVADLGSTSARDVLGLALTDEERSVQIAAARALGRLGARPRDGAISPEPDGSPATLHAADVLELVGRSRDPELVAAAVRAMGEAVSSASAEPDPASIEVVDALAPLAASAPGVVALAVVDALGRAPFFAEGRRAALVRALAHADVAVVQAAILKLGSSERDELARCLDHPAAEVRLLAVEILGEDDDPLVRRHLAERATIEPDRDVRSAIEAWLARTSLPLDEKGPRAS